MPKKPVKSRKSERNYIISSIGAIFVIWATTAWWPELYPFGVFGQPFWGSRGTFIEWVGAIWPIFAWGIGINLLVGLARNMTDNPFSLERFLRRKEEPDAIVILSGGTLVSLFAGVTEELAFRWLLYLSAISTLVFMNWLWGTVFAFIALAFLGLFLTAAVGKSSRDPFPAVMTGVLCLVGLIAFIIHGGFLSPMEWVYDVSLLPIADWASFGKMTHILYQPGGWAVGAAVVSANAFFRDGHKYQGLLGIVNSWYIGLVLFWVMFTYGVWPSMVVHFLYDFLIFATMAFMRLFRR